MVQIYVKYIDDNYYLLDLEESEAINFKLTTKDLNDISKVFAPFTQSFKFKATDKNKRLCGYFGNEKIQRINNEGKFNAKIYISGFLFQSGVLEYKESDYEYLDQKGYSANFASNLTGVGERLGDKDIKDLFDFTDENLNLDWNPTVLQEKMESINTTTLENGIVLKTGVPLISNKRVISYDNDLSIYDNVKENNVRTESNFISLDEVRPAVSYMGIMNHVLKEIGTPVICPLFSELNDLYIYGSSETLSSINQTLKIVTNHQALTYTKGSISGNTPATPYALISVNTTTNIFKIEKNPSIADTSYFNVIDLKIDLNNAISFSPEGIKFRLIIRNTTTGAAIIDEKVQGATFSFFIPYATATLFFQIEILPLVFMSWDSIGVRFRQDYSHQYFSGIFNNPRYDRAIYLYTETIAFSSNTFGGNYINAISTLPDKKAIDFLRSFLKTFNISVLSTGLDDGSMYWLTQDNLKEINKPYSKRIVDYTPYVDVKTTTKKRANDYNVYSFLHAKSKYYDSTYGNGAQFGQLTYPTTLPTKPVKYEVKTDYSIIKQASTFNHPYIRTCLAFEKEGFTILPNGFKRYKPVFDEFTIFYMTQKSLNSENINVEYLPSANRSLTTALEASFKNPITGKLLSFGAEGLDTDSLYLNYYSDFIELLLNPNAYSTNFNLKLPPNEIFLNFANLNQGESNIPTGFRGQNEIIIGEQRYFMSDITINLTGGEAKLTAINL